MVLAAVVLAPVPGRGEWLKVLQDFGHAPAFGCVALVALLWLRTTPLTARWQYLGAWGLTLLLGIATEAAQFFVARDPSWLDLRSDAIGAAAFLGVVAACDSRLRRSVRMACVLVALAVAVVQTLPVVIMLRAYERRSSSYPVLSAFADVRDLYFLRPQWAHLDIVPLPEIFAAGPGETALHVGFTPGAWPGLSHIEPSPDWRGFRTLILEVANPGDAPLALTLRAHDVHHDNEFTDRLNRSFEVPAMSRNELRIPIADIASAPRGRSMDLEHMAGYTLFRNPGSTAEEMYLISLRLAR
jgi:VanZ family protein